MSEAVRIYSTAKGYVQSSYLITTNMARFNVADDSSFVLSIHMLFGFAVELYLKSYLTFGGHTETELRSGGLRHNLAKLHELCETDGFNLPEANRLVDYLTIQHSSFEYRYMKPDSTYQLRPQADVFNELHHLDMYVDRKIGASVSYGREPSSIGWVVPDDFNFWRVN